MPGTNGKGPEDDYSGEDTPNERPQATLEIHKPYVLALTSVIAPLHATALMLSDVLHEFRIAREPASRVLIGQIAEAGKVLEGVGRSLAEGFAK